MKVGQICVDHSNGIYTMKQNPPIFGTLISPSEISKVFGIESCEIRTDFPIQWVNTGLEAVIVPLKDRISLSKISINKNFFKSYTKVHPQCNCNHLFFVDMGNSFFSSRCIMEDFIEDPATGSASGCMAGYLLKHNYFGKNEISYTILQGEDMGRKSVLKIHAYEKNEDFQISVGGKCQTIAFGEWL